MEKIVLIILGLWVSNLSVAQNIGVIRHGYSDEESAYDAVNSWVHNRFNSTDNRIIVEEKVMKKIHAKGQFVVSYNWLSEVMNGGVVVYDLLIEVDKNNVKYEIINMIHRAGPNVGHRSGGSIYEDKPVKGSKIFAKT